MMMLTGGLALLIFFLVIAIPTLLKSFGVNQEYERAVLFRLGRLGEAKGPGWYWLIPWVDRVQKVDLRTITSVLDTQETVTRDGVPVKVNAVLWFRAKDSTRVITTVQNWQGAVIQAAETAMRDVIGQSDLDGMLKDRMLINQRLQDMMAKACDHWGVVVDSIEMKDMDIPEQMQRAIGREAEAIREKRARLIKAEGERDAAQTLAEAAAMVGGTPGAMEMRRLQALTEIGVEHNSTIIAMMPVELIEAAKRIAEK